MSIQISDLQVLLPRADAVRADAAVRPPAGYPPAGPGRGHAGRSRAAAPPGGPAPRGRRSPGRGRAVDGPGPGPGGAGGEARRPGAPARRAGVSRGRGLRLSRLFHPLLHLLAGGFHPRYRPHPPPGADARLVFVERRAPDTCYVWLEELEAKGQAVLARIEQAERRLAAAVSAPQEGAAEPAASVEPGFYRPGPTTRGRSRRCSRRPSGTRSAAGRGRPRSRRHRPPAAAGPGRGGAVPGPARPGPRPK